MNTSREWEPTRVAKQPATDDAANQRATGDVLPSQVAADMSARFGVSFGDVRVHHDSAADRAAKRAGAQAFTHGNDISFAKGRYAPESASGRELIAHELAHVVQQRKGGHTEDAEVRARRAGNDVAAGRNVNHHALGGAPIGTQAQPDDEPAQKQQDEAASATGRGFTHVFDKFAVDKDTLTEKHSKEIDDLAFAISLHTGILARGKAKIEIVGHADTTGKDPHNEELGHKRANTVRSALEKKLTPREGEPGLNLEWSVRSAGEQELLIPTADEKAEPRNRAVEVRVTIESLPAEKKVPEPPKYDWKVPEGFDEPTPPRRRDDDWWKRAEENERRIKELDKKIGKKKPSSLQDVIVDGVMNKIVNPVIDALPLSKENKDTLRGLARKGIETGTEKACEAGIDAMNLDPEHARAAKEACKAGIKYKERER